MYVLVLPSCWRMDGAMTYVKTLIQLLAQYFVVISREYKLCMYLSLLFLAATTHTQDRNSHGLVTSGSPTSVPPGVSDDRNKQKHINKDHCISTIQFQRGQHQSQQ